MNVRIVTVKSESRTYEIPEAWLVGATHDGRRTYAEAIAHWIEQERMEREFHVERGMSAQGAEQ